MDGMHAEPLQPLDITSVPELGTFWLLQRQEPPWPFLPPIAREFKLPVYMLDKRGTYVVDARWVDYTALAHLESLLVAAERRLGLTAQNEDSASGFPKRPLGTPSSAGPTGSGGSHSGGLCLLPPVFITSDSVSLTVTNAEPGAAYDLFLTTNLSPAVPGLNLTNWLWLGRGQPGQTNFVVTGLVATESYFRLGTLLDSDADGLTDAFENLVSHTDRLNPDTDRDGLSDGWEWNNGMNPLLNESALDGYRKNYTYDTGGWLRLVSGVWTEGITLDAEGNILQLQ
ncbi:MAG: thrombospondin type 3 repeat-containing protein [Verrucomicrobiota bacterium]|nr:thrombospondin type 3 repeat-containing protein [Limisphaera sp.]MDW8382943.1 thrombospondin type 3 repeat-containing protein [Verrucomicrobiota bacterium]